MFMKKRRNSSFYFEEGYFRGKLGNPYYFIPPNEVIFSKILNKWYIIEKALEFSNIPSFSFILINVK